MRCHHFDAGTCRSCTLLDVPHARQIDNAQAALIDLLTPFGGTPDAWDAPVTSADAHFRAKVKMVVAGSAAAPILTLPRKPGETATTPPDLVDCPLYPREVGVLLEHVRGLIRRAQVPPYDVDRRRGEAKGVIVTIAPSGPMMLRLVLRTEAALDRIREHLPALLDAQPAVVSVSANIHPEPVASLEGPTEIPLAGSEVLELESGPVLLLPRARSFIQTNTAVAGQLYAQVGAWIDDIASTHEHALRIWDLYCGLGGFALACAGPDREVTGIEVSAPAIDSARESARRMGVEARFEAADATAWAAGQPSPPDVVIVNPPRRGIGPELAAWIEGSGMRDVVYSSCNPATLAADLAAMPSLRIVRGRLIDMFPHTRHDEVVVRLRRNGGADD